MLMIWSENLLLLPFKLSAGAWLAYQKDLLVVLAECIQHEPCAVFQGSKELHSRPIQPQQAMLVLVCYIGSKSLCYTSGQKNGDTIDYTEWILPGHLYYFAKDLLPDDDSLVSGMKG